MLYPFGYGLSYTTFKCSDLSVPTKAVAAGQAVDADVSVTNAGKIAGDEAVQLSQVPYRERRSPYCSPRISEGSPRTGREPESPFRVEAERSRHGDRGRKSNRRSR